jgi:hypothetical protein
MNEPNLISDETLYKLAAAHAQLTHLIETPPPADQASAITHHEQFKLLTEQISAVFLTHAPEFLGAIFVLRGEYTPLIRALAPLVRHALAIPGPSSPISEAAQVEVTERQP